MAKNLRSHHRVSRTTQGDTAFRHQSMEPVWRELLQALRGPAPVTVAELMDQLPTMDIQDFRKGVTELATQGWVLIEEPATAYQAPLIEPEVDQEKVLSDLLARRPPPPRVAEAAIAPEPTVPPGATTVTSLPVARTADESAVPVPSDPDSDRRLRQALGLIGPALLDQAPVPSPRVPLDAAPPSPSEPASAPAAPPRPVDPRQAALLERLRFDREQREQSRAALQRSRGNQEREEAEQAARRAAERERERNSNEFKGS
jgi:hypothetical protein